ncbi:MAG: putative anti sigma factor [Gemmatimonadetes bacterium]|nr:putative anti sigma factor [Gemmatimonadota bacterium]
MPETPPSDAGLRVSLQVDFPSDVAYIERVVDLVRHPCAELAFNRHHLALNVPVALSEALSNAILRANREDPAKRVRVRANVDATKLVVEIVDEGCRFDLDAKTRNPTDAENIEAEDGRGLFLMRKLMDDVERFDASPGGDSGNVVRLTLARA